MSYHTYGVSGGSMFWGDAVATPAALPVSGAAVGELRYVISTSSIYEWNGTAWVLIINPSGYVTAVTGTAPIAVTTGTTPAVSIPKADLTHDGYLSQGDWTTFNSKQPAGNYPVMDGSNLIDITNIPPAALERLVIVADQAARYALTISTVQNGDTVKQIDTGEMWFVKDDTNLGNANGYAVYTAGTASAVAWSGITSKPTTISGFGITDAVAPALISTPATDDMVFWDGTKFVNSQKYTSAGCIIAPSFTDNGSGSITVNTVEVSLWNNASFIGQAKKYTLAPLTETLTDMVFNYIVGDYNAGSPILKVITDISLITESEVVPVYSVFRKGNDINVQPWDTLGRGLPNKVHQSIVKTQRYRRESGLGLVEYGTRNIDLGSGVMWLGANKVGLDQVLSAADNITLYYHTTGGAWTTSTVTQYNNTDYDTGTALAPVNAGRYVVNWVYRGVEVNKRIFIVLGTVINYTLLQAQNSQPPVLPPEMAAVTVLVGRIIVLKSAATATQIDSAFAVSFIPSAAAVHNDLASLQGGTTDQYYHLNATEYIQVNNKVPYHGFENRTSSTLVWTDTTPARTLTLTGTFSYYYQGTKFTVAATSPAVQITNTVGLWYFYFSNLGVLTASQTFPAFTNGILCATIYWNGTIGVLNDERHGYTRNLDWHEWAHLTIGTRYGSGLDITNTGTGAAATFSVSTGTIYDEDIDFSTSSPTTQCRVWYQTAATAPGYTVDNALSTMPFKWNSGTSRVQYVNAAGPYALADCASNRFVNVWIYGTTGTSTNIWALVETIATATNGYTSTNNARQAPPPNLGLLGLPAEMKILYRLVVRGDGIVQTAVSADDYRNSSPLPAGGTASTTAASVSFSPYDGIASATVQGAIEELADERQIKLLTSAKSANFTAAADFIYLVDTTSVAISVQLPAPVDNMQFIIKDVGFNANVNNITLLRAAAESIEGVAASYILDSAGGSTRLISNGTNWFRV